MVIETPKNTGYFDLLMPIAKGRVFAGMTVGVAATAFIFRSLNETLLPTEPLAKMRTICR
ncbi:MAG: hypothetical protein EOO03_02220 [Chitinophagaceae bacterium]|nr:MAG: hypothetical protein EOO03_02220 [Chitinophagaceae bacterium]